MIKELLHQSLNITNKDNVCIIHDVSGIDIASDIQYALNQQAKLIHVGNDLALNFPEELKNILLGDEFNVIIIAIKREQDIWHRDERRRAKKELGKRLVSIIVPHEVFIDKAFQIDLSLVGELADYVYSKLIGKESIRIESENGTNISAEISGVFKENGDYASSGSGGDFPPGEVGLFIKEGSMFGRIVYDLKVRYLGRVKAGDVILTIEKDKIENISGSKAKEFEEILSKDKVLAFISEISIGVNPHIKNYPSPHTIVEEKMAGTVHFGHGSNGAYGTRRGCHFDCVISNPTVFINGLLLMRNGKFVSDDMTGDLVGKLRQFGLVKDES